MLITIIQAINSRQVLSLTYDGIARIVEPHAVGRSTTGKDLLRCYQVRGGHTKAGHDWDLLSLAKITGLTATGATFGSARDGYKRGDPAMIDIYAEL